MADVICPNCGERYHQTTEKFRLGAVTTGDMLRIKPQYADWSSFPEDEGRAFGDLECPGCGGAYSDDGRVRIDMDQYIAEGAGSLSIKRRVGRQRKEA